MQAPAPSPQAAYEAAAGTGDPENGTRRTPTAGYALSLILILAATLVSLWLNSIVPQTALVLLYPAVAVAAWLAGFGPGLLAAALGAVAAYSFVLPAGPGAALNPAASLFVSAALFACGVLVTFAVSSARQERKRTDHDRIEANSFAAKLHLQLMLAESEIERLRLSIRNDSDVHYRVDTIEVKQSLNHDEPRSAIVPPLQDA